MSREETDFRTRYLYNHKGRCRKCDHKMMHIPIAGAVPSRDVCPACSWTDWDKVYFRRPGSQPCN